MGSNKHYNHLGVGPSLWAAPCCREAERREEGGQEGCGLLTMSWSFTFQLFVHRQNQSPSISGLSGYLVCRPMGERTARSEGFTLWAWEKYIHWLLFCKTNRGSDRRTDGHTDRYSPVDGGGWEGSVSGHGRAVAGVMIEGKRHEHLSKTLVDPVAVMNTSLCCQDCRCYSVE